MPRTFLFFFCAVFFALWQSTIAGQPITQVKQGIVHEAFIQKTGGTILLNSIDKQPPPPIQERTLTYSDPQRVWIPGYWQWDNARNDFVWVSGTLRRPPPGYQWISEFWFPFEGGWVHVPGFWSAVSLEYISYINQPPPDPINENIPDSPGEEYFWAPGYWEFSHENQQFSWIMGKWVSLDPNWVYVSAHYMWHPQGYIFIAPYWDWNVIDRGDAYATVFIEPAVRLKIIYEPAVILEVSTLAEILFPCYPDYMCFFHHWFHLQPQFWNDFCCVPPWWHWNSWWGLPWHDQWGLWWWYSHPGYPHPQWITPTVTAAIPPPPPQLLSMVRSAQAPLIVTSKGVITQNTLLQSIASTTKAKAPILPANTKIRTEILENATTQLKQTPSPLKPTGTIKKAEEVQPSLPKIAMESSSTSTPSSITPSTISPSTTTQPTQKPSEKKGGFRPMEVPKKPSASHIAPSRIDIQRVPENTFRSPSPIQTHSIQNENNAPLKSTPKTDVRAHHGNVQNLRTPSFQDSTTPVEIETTPQTPTTPQTQVPQTKNKPVPIQTPQQQVQIPVTPPAPIRQTPTQIPQQQVQIPQTTPLIPQQQLPIQETPAPTPKIPDSTPVPQQPVQPRGEGSIMRQVREQYQLQQKQTEIQNQLIQEQDKRKQQDIKSLIK